MSLPFTVTQSSASSGDLCVARVPIFRGLTHEQQREIAMLARPTLVERSATIYSTQSPISQLMVVHTGRIKISRTSADGHEQIIRILEAGEFVGESTFLTGSYPDHDATALEPAQLCVFHHTDLGRLFEQHPSIGFRMLESVSRRLGETEARLASVISGDVSSRLADYLLALPTHITPDGDSAVTLPLTKKIIASLLDTTPESLSRQLRLLSETGVIVQRSRGNIVITDVEALNRLATRM